MYTQPTIQATSPILPVATEGEVLHAHRRRSVVGVREYRRPTATGAMALGAGVTVTTLLPVFLTGAMAVQLTEELAFGTVGLGLAVAAFRLGGASTSLFLGRLADRLGAMRTIRLSAVIAAVAALGIAVTVDGLVTLVIWLAIGGSALALAQPGANRLLTAVVAPAKLGTAFGFKQSAPPIAGLLAGVAVPLIAINVGWRWAFVLAAVAAISLAAVTSNPPPKPKHVATTARPARQPLPNRLLLVLLAVGFGLGTSTSSAVTTFYVASAASAGSTPAFAGTVLAVASFAAIGARIVAGILSDRLVTGHLLLCAGLVGVGSGGVALLATGSATWMSVGLAIALMGNWGFNGVFWFALMRSHPDAPGRITGAVAPGGLLGSMLGPLAVGFLIDATSYPTAWLTVTAVGIVAATTLALGHQRLKQL
jgi:MFS family permease